jgi:DNA-3-methyladenine glycosylase I
MKVEKCSWCVGTDIYENYHDQEWGVPVHDDQILFEFLILEGAQAGLSWVTVLKKREGYRKAFANFDYKIIAEFPEEKVEELMQFEEIIRNRLKIKATITNAQNFMEVQKEFGSFSNYLWNFVNHQPIQNHLKNHSIVPAKTELSDAISKDLKKRGFKFIGSTIIYAYMQAIGMVNDHVQTCFRYEELKNS